MSIIYDALQKTQKNRQKPQKTFFLKKFRLPSIWFDLIILAIIATLLFMIIVAYYPRVVAYFKRPHVAEEKLPDVAQKPATTVTGQPVLPVAPVSHEAEIQAQIAHETAYKSKNILNGVFLSDQEKVVLINNQTYHIGDVVDGMMIVNINSNSIKLQDGKHTIIMKVAS